MLLQHKDKLYVLSRSPMLDPVGLPMEPAFEVFDPRVGKGVPMRRSTLSNRRH